ncbi:MAG: hypothetical protein AAFY15_11820, partial [Cyanobacteria bacterium J06648_11]
MKSEQSDLGLNQKAIVIICLAWLSLQSFHSPESAIAGLAIIAIWFFSISLHEYSHATIAYLLGDSRVKQLGYLDFNLLRYLDVNDLELTARHAIAFPFIAMAAPILIPYLMLSVFPGGQVYIRPEFMRER